MQPIGNAWAKLPRLVRDTARELGKRIELELRGAETELDRQVLELIKDPLTHMVRNSADHGLESPAERLAAGKPEAGRIVLTARHQAGEVIVELADDGRGLDTAAIARKALAQGLAGEAALATMTEAEIHRFIFRPGFSTAATVTAVSGRGVGMDVVRANMERIGGVVDVASRAGRGTTFAIRIPLTLAIVSALIVEVAGTRFAIPQTGVRELVRLGGGGARADRIGNATVLRLRGRLLPLLSLARVLGLDADGDGGFVVVAQAAGTAFGLVVDRLHDIEEIVVKPVSPVLRHVAAFAGNTILGDGGVIMILDAAGIARAAGIGGDAEEPAVAETATMSVRNTALLLFRAGDGAPKAVPLDRVARLDEIVADRIEHAGDAMVLQYAGALLPLARIGEGGFRPRQTMLVIAEADRQLGLLVDAILDVVEQPLTLEGAARPGFLGSAIVAGRATEVLDSDWWLARPRSGATAA
jgi:two-component system chemotaxis sensor kinase CheA